MDFPFEKAQKRRIRECSLPLKMLKAINVFNISVIQSNPYIRRKRSEPKKNAISFIPPFIASGSLCAVGHDT